MWVKNVQEDMQTGGLEAGQHQQESHYVVFIIHIQQEQKISFGWYPESLVVMINLSMFGERLMLIFLCTLNVPNLKQLHWQRSEDIIKWQSM